MFKKSNASIFSRIAAILLAFVMLLTMQGYSFMSYATDEEPPEEAKEELSVEENEAAEEPEVTEEELVPDDEDIADEAETEDGVLEISSEAGSYTVDFYYTSEDGYSSEYHLKGGSEIMLSELFARLGINHDAADISETVFTDNDLVKFVKERDDYRVISLKPFDTEETLTITFNDGEVIVIGVEDATYQGWTAGGNVYWQFNDATGKLIIRPKDSLGGASGTAEITRDMTNASDWGWHAHRANITEIEIQGTIKSDSTPHSLNFMFANCPKLTTVTGLENFDTSNVGGLARMFSGCTSLTEIDLSSFKNDGKIFNMQNMFNGCTNLKTVKLNNPEFKTRNQDGKSGAMLTGMFKDCTSLEEVDMSNITLTGEDVNLRGLTNPFTGSSVKKIIMNDVKFVNVKTIEQFMNSLDNLEEVSMTGNVDVSSVQYMTEMFARNPSLKKIDISGFGKLDSIVNMEALVKDDTALETLIIDGMDNSHIGPKNNRHSLNQTDPNNPRYIPPGDETKIGATEFGRDFGLKTCTSLKTLSAKGAKVWMVSNDRGVPGSEYYSAASDKDILWWWMTTEEPGDNGKQLKFEADGGKGPYTLNKRDYVDLITDRDGKPENTHIINPPQDALPDKDKNINIQNDLNPNGAGFLAPGVYTVLDSYWETEQVNFPDSYYRISYIGEVPFEVRVNGQELSLNDGESTTVGNENNLVVAKSPNSNNIYINTTTMTWPTSGTKTLNDTIEVVYKDAAIDINGKKHDVVITITEIKFKDLDKVPTNPNRGSHNQNRYYDTDGGGQYYRTIMQARSDGTIFRDLLRISDPATPWVETSALSGGAGTDIKFNIKIDKANPDTSFVFYVDDLDVAYSQNWQYPVQNDPCYDTLTPPNSTYGIGGEGFELRDGNDLTTVTFADHTGLFLADNNKVLSTGSDPSTSWSEFAVKAKADGNGSSYTWTSGIGCSTYVLKNTPKMDTGSIKIQPQVTKTLQGGTLTADQFEFTLTEERVDPTDAPKPSNSSQTKKNDATGTVTFDTLEFKANGTNALIYDSTNTAYYPGSSPSNNTRGNGQHNTFTYVYKVKEVAGTDPDITYNVGSKEYELKIVITTPENDAEMAKGIKAEIYVDGTLKNTFWSKEGADVKTFNLGDFINKITEVTLIKNWDDSSNSKNFRPTDLEGYVTYDKDGAEVRLTTSDYRTTHTDAAWVKEGNTWKFTFRLPSGAAFTGGGETAVPKGYTHDQSKDKLDTAAGTLTMTNKLKNTEETATIKRTIEYKYEDDNSPVLDEDGKAIVVEQSLTFKREVTGWDDNGDPIWGAWTPDAGTLPQANSPAADRSGYKPKQTSVSAVNNLTQADSNFDAKAVKYPDITVLYEKAPKAGNDKTYGGIGETQNGAPSFTPGSKDITSYILIDPITGELTDNVTIKGEGTYTIDKDSGVVTFVPEEDFIGSATTIKVRGIDENGNYADGSYTPVVVDNHQTIEKTQTIKYLYEDGTSVLDENGLPFVIVRSAIFTRTGIVDPLTGSITWNDWTPASLEQQDSPEIDGYTPNKARVESKTYTPDNWPEDETIIYTKIPDYTPTPTPDPDETDKTPGVETGDDTNVALWILMLISALVTTTALRVKRKVNQK